MGEIYNLPDNCSVAQSCQTLHDPMDCSMPGFFVLHHLLELKLKSIESVMPSNRLILCHPLLLLPSIFPSIRVCFSESVLSIRWPKYWSFSFSISPSSDYSRLLSFSINWLNLLAVQGILKSLLQHHSSKHEFFGTQPSLCDPALTSIHDYWKIHSFDYTVFCQQSKGSVF